MNNPHYCSSVSSHRLASGLQV